MRLPFSFPEPGTMTTTRSMLLSPTTLAMRPAPRSVAAPASPAGRTAAAGVRAADQVSGRSTIVSDDLWASRWKGIRSGAGQHARRDGSRVGSFLREVPV
jgi:hypothetical protein